ncbi:LLM class flavin-dependent oxidoreductase [Pseudactinotalea sp.]|uniref:LLM class flavin-dependent oxidoreductase n=1 Tax=Pseudactinotalea sp. TaxID=1926260 RepID=UPI003B3AB92E
MTIRSLSFLSPGTYDSDNPRTGLEDTLGLFSYGERLGYQGAWVRQRHLEAAVSSAAVFLSAATQRTDRIELGTAVVPIGYESPLRLAEDLATVDVLAGGRLQIGVSAGTPPHVELVGDRVFDGDWEAVDFSHQRILRFAKNLDGSWIGSEDTRVQSPNGPQRPRVQPYAAGLTERLWYGGGSSRSTIWAAEHGLNLLTGNIVAGEGTDDFWTAQLTNLQTFRQRWRGAGEPRIAVGRVVVPTDSADAATRDKYREYEASRHARTLAPQGERRTLFAPDLVGSSAEIVERLQADAAIGDVTELRLELPYGLRRIDYEQILHDVATQVAPALGWQPALVAA